jgi:phosphomannomutase
MAWEAHATAVVNAEGAAALGAALRAALSASPAAQQHGHAAAAARQAGPATVLLARDTRPSGPALAAAAAAGAASLGATMHDLGATHATRSLAPSLPSVLSLPFLRSPPRVAARPCLTPHAAPNAPSQAS